MIRPGRTYDIPSVKTGLGEDSPVGLSSTPMQEFLSAILAGAPGEEIAAIPIPESYRAAYVKRDELAMFEGMESEDKDPRKSLHVGEVATPELAPDEVYIAVMASAINFNTRRVIASHSIDHYLHSRIFSLWPIL